MGEKLYGPIGLGRLLDIEVYNNDNQLIYAGMLADASNEVKNLMYKDIKLINNKSVYYV